MYLLLLILGAATLPFVWGCGVYWLFVRLWPQQEQIAPEPVGGSSTPIDFQI